MQAKAELIIGASKAASLARIAASIVEHPSCHADGASWAIAHNRATGACSAACGAIIRRVAGSIVKDLVHWTRSADLSVVLVACGAA